jgi:hypothetical protein
MKQMIVINLFIRNGWRGTSIIGSGRDKKNIIVQIGVESACKET